MARGDDRRQTAEGRAARRILGPGRLGRSPRGAVLLSLALAVGLALGGGCSADDEGRGDALAVAPLTVVQRARVLAMSPLPPLPPSPSNAYADDEAAARLGQRLFFDTGFSSNGEVACATCHDPAKAFADDLPRAKGVLDVPRHTPTVLLAARQPWQFWDGRADSLWAQALGPIESSKEHNFDRVAVAHRIVALYAKEWVALFGPLPALDDPKRFPPHARPDADAEPGMPQSALATAWAAMTEADRASVNAVFVRFGKAIEAYERRLQTTDIALDRYVAALRAGDATGGGALPPAADRGLRIFVGKGQCVFCHSGPRLSNGAFHNIGLDQPAGAPAEDRGRYQGAQDLASSPFNCLGPFSDAAGPEQCAELPYLRLKEAITLGAFKTPSLRSAARTAPYMHAGQYATLADVIDHYDLASEHLAPIGPRESFLTSLRLTAQQRADLRAFLDTLDAQPLDDSWSRRLP